MIGKIKKGSGFKGCVNYVLGKERRSCFMRTEFLPRAGAI